MTTEEFHEKLRQYNFHKVGTGGGCDALVSHILYMESEPYTDKVVSVKARPSAEVMLTAAEDPSVPEADDQVQITIRMEGSDYEITWIASPQETLNFAGSVMTWLNSNK